MGRSSSPLQAMAALLQLLLVQLLQLPMWASAARAGSAGQLMRFRRQQADSASFRWNNPPADSLTVELWFRITDMGQVCGALLNAA